MRDASAKTMASLCSAKGNLARGYQLRSGEMVSLSLKRWAPCALWERMRTARETKMNTACHWHRVMPLSLASVMSSLSESVDILRHRALLAGPSYAHHRRALLVRAPMFQARRH